jgi:hydrogenase nickel incorporation protein HypA/HybF
MHEFGLSQGLLDAVRHRANGRPVAGVRIRAGVRHGVDQASLAQAFAMLATGTEADGATLELVTVPARLRCRSCGAGAPVTDLLATCPACRSDDVHLDGGDDLVLESLRYTA